jgi:thymidylate synthase
MLKVNDIRNIFIDKFANADICENQTVEIMNASFLADEETIFGKLSQEYIQKEFDWYLSESLNVNDIAPPIPQIWLDIAAPDGSINSNYGWCVFSEQNHDQYCAAITSLKNDKYTRQACMIYIRPTMHIDSVKDGMKDFMCTYSAQLLIRQNKLYYLVYMRSNDAIFGYKNDRYWHNLVFDICVKELQNSYPELERGDLLWNAASLHVYPRHFKFLEKSK